MVAYSFDRAVTLFGTSVEADMDEASEDAKTSKESMSKRQRVLDKWLDDGTDTAPKKGRFKDPMAMTAKL